MKERIKGAFTKRKILHFLKMALFVVALSLILLSLLGTEDTYSTDYVAVFEVCGEKVSIEDEQLARALKAIEERKRNIVLQYFFIGDTDTYIGKMLDCSRANVTKCRIQALDKLKQLIEEEKEKCQKS